jgi:putative flavoprotein involved in K+ transport
VRAVQARARGYLVETDDRAYEAGQIVLATGPFQTPRIPRSRRTWPPACISSTAATTADPTRSQTGPCSWSVAPTRAFRSRASSPQPIGPPRDRFATGSAPAAAWTRPLQCLTATELMGKTVDSRLGRRLSGRDALIGSSPRAIRRQGVHVRPRAISAAGSTITFIDARPRDGHLGDGLRRQRFLHPLARLRRRRSCHPRARGVTAVPVSTSSACPGSTTRGSALIGWVKHDAQHIADQISKLASVHVDAPDRLPLMATA